MSKRKLILIALLVTAAMSVSLCLGNMYYRNYPLDALKGFFIDIQAKLQSPENSFTIIDPASYRRYVRTYADAPRELIPSGNFLFYRAGRETSVKSLARDLVSYTRYYKAYRLEKAIRDWNGLEGDTVGKGSVLYIPASHPPLLADIKNRRKPEKIVARGLYYSGSTIAQEEIIETIKKYKKIGINAIVFDVKDVSGIVNYRSRVPEVMEYNTHEKRTIDSIDKLIRALKANGIYTIARIAVFRDHLLYRKNADYAIKSRGTGERWNQDASEHWCDPTSRNVQDYNIALAIELAEMGVEEIQFDYIRFPTAGNLADAKYAHDFGTMSKVDTITLFLKRAYEEISRRNSLLSIDIFGVVAWEKEVDIRHTGQRLDLLAKYCDIISPMLYPSHFNDDFDGFENPGDHPYHFIFNGCKKVKALSGNRVIRPWLQAFKWRISNYNEKYIMEQIKACRDSGATGYLFWNASNNYEVVYRALVKIAAEGKQGGYAGNP